MLTKIAGLLLAIFGFLLVLASYSTKDPTYFLFSVSLSLPSIYFGFKLMELI